MGIDQGYCTVYPFWPDCTKRCKLSIWTDLYSTGQQRPDGNSPWVKHRVIARLCTEWPISVGIDQTPTSVRTVYGPWSIGAGSGLPVLVGLSLTHGLTSLTVYNGCTAGITEVYSRCTAGVQRVYGRYIPRRARLVSSAKRTPTPEPAVEGPCPGIRSCDALARARSGPGTPTGTLATKPRRVIYPYCVRRPVSGWCLSAMTSSPSAHRAEGTTGHYAAKQPSATASGVWQFQEKLPNRACSSFTYSRCTVLTVYGR